LSKNILINSLILSIGILIGRLSGYIREMIIAYKYEVSSQADNIILMLTIPDLLNNLLAGGAISGILIPLLSKSEKIEETLTEFNKKLFIIFIILYIFVIFIIFLVHEFYIFSLLAISLIAIFPNILTFISSSYLQYQKRFKAQSLNTLVFNISIIAFLLLGFQNYLFAFGVILASILRMIWISYDLRFTDITIKSFFFKNIENKIKYKLLIFMIFANGLIFINPMIDKIFASFLEEGSVAILSYSEKIYLLPVSVFLTTYAVAMFPDLSQMVINKDKIKIKKLLKKSITFNLIISLLIAIIIYIFSYEIVNFLYSIANIKNESIQLISMVLNGYMLSIVFAGTNSILLNVFFAYKWYNKLLYYSVFMLTSKIVINSFIIYFNYNIFYIALSTSLLMVMSVTILLLTYIYSQKKEY
jgi:murein biosynthesis integral membrane protein MurJ